MKAKYFNHACAFLCCPDHNLKIPNLFWDVAFTVFKQDAILNVFID